MSEKILVKDLQKLDPGSELVHLFELEYVQGSFMYFHSGLDDDLTTIQMRDYENPSTIRTYVALPSQFKGVEIKNDGAIARPELTLANAQTVFSDAVGTLDYQKFLGLKIIRRTTLKKYLHGEGSATNPPTEYPRAVYLMDRIKTRTKTAVTIECVAPFDLETIRLPGRNVLPDRCPFIYQGAGEHKQVHEKAQSGCTWHLEGKHKTISSVTADGTEYTVYVNIDDEYVVPSTTSFTTYSSGAVTADSYYKTTSSVTKYASNGTSSTATVNNYWQAVAQNNAPGTPSDSNSSFKRVRIYTTYSHGTEYFAYSDDRHNDYVIFTDNVATSHTNGKTLLWKVRAASKSVAPDYVSDFWVKGDGCSKRLNGCKARFGFQPINSGTASSTGKANPSTEAVLPFGGFPAAKAFS
jgi:lambda family phage minor tail protein L